MAGSLKKMKHRPKRGISSCNQDAKPKGGHGVARKNAKKDTRQRTPTNIPQNWFKKERIWF